MTARRLRATLLLLALWPGRASAQAVSGVAEWTVGRGGYRTDAGTISNNSFSQLYSVGYKSSLWDPRFLQYTAGVSFGINSLTFGPQSGSSRDLGYLFGVNLFPERPFPFSLQVRRDRIGESGDFQSASVVRGGIALEPGQAIPDFLTRNTGLQLNWQLNIPGRPRFDLSYRRDTSTVTGGGAEAGQLTSDLIASAYKETAKIRHTLRYQRNRTDSIVSRVFNQRLTDLNYELNATVGTRSRALVRAGRRSAFSLFDTPPAQTDFGTPAYQPAMRGTTTTYFSEGSLYWDPARRLQLDATVSADLNTATGISTRAMLVSSGVSYDVGWGLALSGRGTLGLRGQTALEVIRNVRTSNVSGSVRLSRSVKFIQYGGSATRFLGSNTFGEGAAGTITGSSASLQTNTTFARLPNVSLGYESSRAVDDVLELGNMATERRRAAVTGGVGGRLTAQADWEESTIDRGRGLLASTSHIRMTTATVGTRLGRVALTANVGEFEYRSDMFDSNRTRFVGGTLSAVIGRSLSLSWNARAEQVVTTLNRQRQNGLYSQFRLDYRLRLFTFGVEHRYTDLEQIVLTSDPYLSRGSRFLFRISRKFGF